MSDYQDTGYPAVDSLEHIKRHLDTQIGTWGIKEVVMYPKAQMERLNPPILQLDFMREDEPEVLGLGSGVVPMLHTVNLRLWYFSELFSAKSRYADIVSKLSQIRKYLIQNPEPDGYGHLYTAAGELRLAGFNIEVGTVAAGNELYVGGYIDLVLHVVLTY